MCNQNICKNYLQRKYSELVSWYDKKKRALIDYSVDKIFRGRGWGKLMLAKAMLELNKNKKLKYFQAKVKKNNFKSIKIFDSLSFLKNSRGRYLEFRKSI